MTEKPTGRGGPGRGQGRKPKPVEEKYVAINLKVPPDLLEWLAKSTDNRNGFIVEAIREKIERIKMSNLQNAAQEYINRQSRTAHPEGNKDKGGRWYPKDGERCQCCQTIREPSRSYPWSLMTHCRTIKHIANLYQVDEKEMRKEVKKLKQ